MLLQTSASSLFHLSSAAVTTYSSSSSLLLPLRRRSPPAVPAAVSVRPYPLGIRCSISQVHSYGTVDYERRPALKWSSLYRRISTMDNPSLGSASVLDRWEEDEMGPDRRLVKWDLCRVAKELRKFRRFKLALQVYEWMVAQGGRFTFTSSDMAIQLDLISKVRGIEHAEEYFSTLKDELKDKRTYGALLNAYGQAKMKEKAEAIVETMKAKGYANDALPYNVMMTLYMNVGEHEKVQMTINEMKEKNVNFDIYSYNIWITTCAAMENLGEMERVVETMTADSSISANWTTYTTLATMYIKFDNLEKAESCLKEVEVRITGRDRVPFNYLLGLYSSLGKREEVYRVWNWYKSTFPSMLNLGYQTMLSSLIKMGDIKGAEEIYEDWLSVTSNYDPRICQIPMGWYARQGLVDKAKGLLDRLIEKGGKPKPITWEILAEGYMKEEQVSEALSCLKKAADYDGFSKWRPRPTNVANILAVCREKDNSECVDLLMDVLRSRGCLEKEEYKTLVST